MANDDDSDLTLRPLDTSASVSSTTPVIPALTIAWHPDPARVGQSAPLLALLERDAAVLQRDEPAFFKPGASVGSPVGSRAMNRAPVLTFVARGDDIELRRGGADAEIEVDGAPFTGSRRVGHADLSRGVVLTVGRRFVFVLHSVRLPVSRSPDLGLLGSSDAMEDVRRLILRVGARESPVLIRGPSGTGKELVARAVHSQGARAAGRFVDVNMGSLRPERAAAELFGYEKGAFTGATEAQLGFFRHAHGGTIFLDEIGLTGLEVQQALLRTLQDNRVQSLGSATPRKVDVRVVAATDADLERLRNDGRILAPFYNRLNASFTITLPPLRERRADIGVLLAHVLRTSLAISGEEESRLNGEWLKARTVARVVLSPLVGNVRTLQGLAEHLVVRGAADPHHATLEYLARSESGTRLPETKESPSPRALELSKEQVLAALEQCGWNQSAAARSLKVSRPALRRRLETEPDIRRVIEIPLPRLLRDHEECGGDLDALSKRLGLSRSVLRRRLPSGR